MTSCACVISPADRRYTGWMLSAAARRRASVRARSTNSTVRDAVTSLGLTRPSRSCSPAGRYCTPVTRVRATQVAAPMATFRDGASATVHGRRRRSHIAHYYSGIKRRRCRTRPQERPRNPSPCVPLPPGEGKVVGRSRALSVAPTAGNGKRETTMAVEDPLARKYIMEPPQDRPDSGARPGHHDDRVLTGDRAGHIRPAHIVDRFCHWRGTAGHRLHQHEIGPSLHGDSKFLKDAAKACGRLWGGLAGG